MKRARPKNKKHLKKEKIEKVEKIEIPEEKEELSAVPEEEDIYSDITQHLEARRAASCEKAAPKEQKVKKKRHPIRAILVTLIVFFAVFFLAMGIGIFDDTDLLTPLENGKINVLVMGVDEDGLRTDAIMLATYDANAAEVNLISIPRDTKVFVENRRVTRKINEIHAMSSKDKQGEILGATATAEAVSQLTGIPVNYYAEFSFSAIDHLFEILGPVEFDVPDVEGGGKGMNYDDPYQNLHIHLKPGLQKLSGNQVQQFLRYRKSNSGKTSGSDTDRVARQQEFVKAVVEQKVNAAMLLKLPSIYSQLSKEIKTNISAGDITRYIRYLNKLTSESIHSQSLPGEAKMLGGGSYFVCDLEKLSEITKALGYETEPTDRITLSENNTQKPLKAGNVGKKNKATPTPSAKPSVTEPARATKTPENAPTKEPTQEPTKAPVVTKPPTKAPTVTKPPLEELDDDYQVID